MNVALVCYATDNYITQQIHLVEEAYSEGIRCVYYPNREMLERTDFYTMYKCILDEKRGAGCCLWKPYYIHETLRKNHELVIYADCGDRIKPGFLNFIKNKLTDRGAVLVENTHINKHHTKRDCFDLMGCDTEVYWNHPILEAGIIAFKNTPSNLRLIEEWMFWCTVPNVVIDTPGKLENFPGYTNHKCDQSILTNLVIRNNLPTVPIQEVMQYVDFNYRG